MDGSGQVHTGITTIPLPVLKSSQKDLQVLKEKVSAEAFQDLLVVDFSNAAQTTKTYEEYTRKIATYSSADLRYLGLLYMAIEKNKQDNR